MRNKPLFTVLLALTLAAPPASAVFEDVGLGADQAAMAWSGSVLDGHGLLNPAAAGSTRKTVAGAHYLSSLRLPSGPYDFSDYSFDLRHPLLLKGRQGTFTGAVRYRTGSLARRRAPGTDSGQSRPDPARQRDIALGWSSWQLMRVSGGSLDLGVNFRMQQLTHIPSEEAVSNPGLDLGAVYRGEEGISYGFSILNLGNPSFETGTLADNSPRIYKLGAAQEARHYRLAMDFTRRSDSAGQGVTYTLSSGAERAWHFLRRGALLARGGLHLGDASSLLALGAGWRLAESDFSYAFMLPLSGGQGVGHALTLNLRFGDRDASREWENLLQREMKYRRDLLSALDEASLRERALKDELDFLRREFVSLNSMFASESERAAMAGDQKRRVEDALERQRRAAAELKALEEKRRKDKLTQLSYQFSLDFEAYLKMKGGGAPPESLRAALGRVIGQYQDSGIDISRATVELQSLMGK
ncbi:MAG: hypothetical protein FD189_360 [Elusimicrobia bacterium]|nr:MAG: hypothetical protein FD154_440 [Elusimicrobiota bacterium]KAF0157839.1 MAG: hypothetical protein FD189_360 [Elusimicrobiota bacterium]